MTSLLMDTANNRLLLSQNQNNGEKTANGCSRDDHNAVSGLDLGKDYR